MEPLTPDQAARLTRAAKQNKGGRPRHQQGYVEECGAKNNRFWRGHYYLWLLQPDGSSKRKHKTVNLGPRKVLKKWEAEVNLRSIVERETAIERVAIPDAKLEPSVPRLARDRTLRWFWLHRFRPIKENHWKKSSRPKVVRFIEKNILEPLGSKPLHEIDRFSLQQGVEKLTSHSARHQFITYLRTIYKEAIAQDLVTKNPAESIKIGRPPGKGRVLTIDEVHKLLGVLKSRDRLIVRMFLGLGLRAGELFALRRNDVKPDGWLMIDEAISEELRGANKSVEPKTTESMAAVWIPESLRSDIDQWVSGMEPEALLFPSDAGTPILPHNYLFRVLKPAAEAAGLKDVNHRVFRRTCGTLMQGTAGVKDIQAHLRHSSPDVTLRHYVKPIDESVKSAVEGLDQMLREHIQ
jgi:integrase